MNEFEPRPVGGVNAGPVEEEETGKTHAINWIWASDRLLESWLPENTAFE